MKSSIVIVGAGQAAGQAIASLKALGHEGRITLVGDETLLPYQRPPLSKKFLSGEIGRDRLMLKAEDFYAAAGVDVRLGLRADGIDRAGRSLVLSNGARLPYDKLLIATGSRVRRLTAPGADLEGVHYLRSVSDVEALRPALKPGARLAVIGGGYIGLEVAAVARTLGLEVTIIEMADRCLARVTSPEISHFFQAEHRSKGVHIHCGEVVAGLEGHRRLERIRCASGREIPADIALVGIGILPNVELAAAAGLTVENGILVDETAQTSDPDIFAAGDCTCLPSALYGRRIRLESVHNAIEQGKTAAGAMLGRREPYDQVPWFWSDQYDLKLQIAGLSAGYDALALRGDPARRSFAVFYLKAGVLIAVDAVNAPSEYMMGRKLIGDKARIAPDRLANPAVPMKEMMA